MRLMQIRQLAVRDFCTERKCIRMEIVLRLFIIALSVLTHPPLQHLRPFVPKSELLLSWDNDRSFRRNERGDCGWRFDEESRNLKAPWIYHFKPLGSSRPYERMDYGGSSKPLHCGGGCGGGKMQNLSEPEN